MRHCRSDWDGIQDNNQGKDTVPHSSIADDEPVFLLRAKDPAAAYAVEMWADLVADQAGIQSLLDAFVFGRVR